MSTSFRAVVLTLVVVFGGGLAAYAQAQSSKPTLNITTVPSFNANPDRETMEPIAGTVRDAPRDVRVVVFAHTNAWYVQPYLKAPFTDVRDGVWQSSTHLGTEYAALLVTSTYKVPEREILLLPVIGADVLAIARVPGKR
ncbi:MAG: hypothetical protein HOP16_09800 [Acidobacteria bacterium]|nr:hypothetical protein [Acidobacteriota bacterium]